MQANSPEHILDSNKPVSQQAGQSTIAELTAFIDSFKGSDDTLIELLHAVQQRLGYLDKELLGNIASKLDLPPSLVYGVASFYHAFRLAPQEKTTCTVCTGTACHLKGGSRLLQALEQHLGIRSGSSSAEKQLSLEQVRCMGACGMAPLVTIGGRHHAHMDADGALQLLTHISQDDPTAVHELSAVRIHGDPDTRLVLTNCTAADPADLPTARAAGAYETVALVVNQMTPEEVCRQISASGLRGRGGAGYPTGRKWDQVRMAHGRKKYVVANGDEGDPGAFMDRTLMECDPHRVLEGMVLAGYAVGASSGFIYVRSEYPLAASRLMTAIRQAEKAGLLGRNLFTTHFSFTLQVRIGAGAFVCGEETALLASIMGRRGQPVIRPPYPASKGLWGHPTLINNVETFGMVTAAFAQGGEHFSSLGTPGNRGTKVFSLSGDVAREGVVEVPLGTTMRELLEMAGGVTGGAFKAAQTGGASGGCIPASQIDLPIDYESLKTIGTIIGSGGVVILNDSRCMVDLARFFMRFCSEESCGKCTPCRAGTQQAVRILDQVCDGSATESDLDRLVELCHLMRETSLCGLGISAPAPVLSTLRWYRHEYLAHLNGGACPTGTCQRREIP
jgi:bidirectional [NiFe] hydrogenase diaphorase subunit